MNASQIVAVVMGLPVFQQALFVVATIAAVLLFARWLKNFRIDQKVRNVPRPPGFSLPFIGHALYLIGARPWQQMMLWAKKAGGTVFFKLPGQRIVYISTPQMLKRVLQTHQRNYRKDRAAYKSFMCLLGTGLVTSEDEAWRKGRLLLSSAMRIDILEAIPEVGIQAAMRLIDNAISRDGLAIDISEEYRHLTLQVIGQAVLSLSPEECNTIFPQLYLPIVTECNEQVWAPWRQFMPWLQGCKDQSKCLGELNTYLSNFVRTRWAERTVTGENKDRDGHKQDILDRYMGQLTQCDAQDVQQLRDDLKTMLLAGHETSAAVLTWATYELLCHPEYRTEIENEYNAVFGHLKKGELPKPDDVKKLKWAPAVLRETMRKHSVVPLVMRTAAKDDFIAKKDSGLSYDMTIPAGCSVMVGINGVHCRSESWPEPELFKPERFFDMDEIDPFAWIPFINGPRNCLGQHLALLEMQLVLSYVFGRNEVKLEQDLKVAGKPHAYTIPAVPAEGLLVSLTKKAGF